VASGAPLPPIFRSLRLLRGLSIFAMAASLAAVTGGVMAAIFDTPAMGVLAGVPTLLCGLIWGLLLRMRATIGKSKLRWGWLASVPLAMMNGAIACGLTMALVDHRPFLETFVLGGLAGATIGAIFWMPGLIATLAFFGGPLSWSQRLADRGLAGEERGEGGVGAASALLAALGLTLAFTVDYPTPPADAVYQLGGTALLAFSLLGAAAGLAAVLLALYRELRRRRFVETAAAGNLAGFRVDEGAEGKVLVRVTSRGEGYRVADVEEEMLALTEAGEVITELEGRHLAR
jgi:hypothetical protein